MMCKNYLKMIALCWNITYKGEHHLEIQKKLFPTTCVTHTVCGFRECVYDDNTFTVHLLARNV